MKEPAEELQKQERRDFFHQIEEELQTKIPETLKNTLNVNGFNSECTLRCVDQNDLRGIEEFMRNSLPKIIKENDRKKYYGIYENHPEEYTIPVGYKKIIQQISEHLVKQAEVIQREKKKKIVGNSRAESHEVQRNLQRNGISVSEEPRSTRPSTSKVQSNSTSEENVHIKLTLKKWIQNKVSEERWTGTFEPHFEKILVESGVRGDMLAATITCFCNKKFTVRKVSKKSTCRPRWVNSNFETHFSKKHILGERLDSEAMPKETSHTDKKHKTLGKTIKDFYSPLPINSQKILPSEKINIIENVIIRSRVESTSSTTTSETMKENRKAISSGESAEISEKFNETPEGTSLGTSCFQPNSLPIPSLIPEDNYDGNLDSLSDVDCPDFEDSEHIANISHSSKALPQTASGSSSKWRGQKYQRQERNRRLREKMIEGQALITDYYTTIQTYLDNNPTEGRQFIEKFTDALGSNLQYSQLDSQYTQSDAIPSFLKCLYEIALKNSNRGSNHNVYDETLKKFALYLYYIGGRLLYETLQANLKNTIPSISTLNRHIDSSTIRIQEGELDFAGLNKFLEERHLPKVVWCSEDGTKITGKIEYDPRTNKVIGFVLPTRDGVLDTSAFEATSAEKIESFFEESAKSSYAYVMTAQPLAKNCPAFCFSIHGTDNKFTSNDIISKWQNMKATAFQNFGIILIGFSSDGDTRLLKAMQVNSQFPNNESEQTQIWPWFNMDLDLDSETSSCFVQDTVHIGTKLRTRLLKPEKSLQIGKYVATSEHLQTLINTCGKDQHLLTVSDIKAEDKMNFKSAEKMCDTKVVELLGSFADTQGTCAYLKVMNYSLSSFLNPSIDVEARLYKIWYAVFFCRIWRSWIKAHKEYTLKNNFISLNCYLCIEINAHNLIKIIKMIQSPLNNLTSDMFLPQLFGSQACEQVFRTARSMTSTYSTMVNFSIKDLLHRVDRIRTINNILNDFKKYFVFPREEAKTKSLVKSTSCRINEDIEALTDEQISTTIEKALNDCLDEAKHIFDIDIERDDILRTDASKPSSKTKIASELTDAIDSEDNENLTENIPENIPSLFEFPNQKTDDFFDCDTNSEKPSEKPNDRRLAFNCNLKDYSKSVKTDSLKEDDPYVKICLSDTDFKIVKKSSYCWLLDQSDGRVSTDRLRRFFEPKMSRTSKKRSKGDTLRGSKHRKTNKKLKIIYSKKEREQESTSESDQHMSVDDSTDTEEFQSDAEESNDDNKKGSTSEIILECYYAIYYDNMFYIGRIIEKRENNRFRIKFLEQVLHAEYSWPKNSDSAVVERKFIFYGPISLIGSGPFTIKRSEHLLIQKQYKVEKQKYLKHLL